MPRPAHLCECADHAWAVATAGYVAIVSACDIDLLAASNWHARGKRSGKSGGRYVKILRSRDAKPLGRVILQAESLVDHVNGNAVDCRRPNLRLATVKENARNRRTQRSRIGMKGVRLHRARWKAMIWVDGKNRHLGTFDTAQAAANAYDRAARTLHGEFAALNSETRRVAK